MLSLYSKNNFHLLGKVSRLPKIHIAKKQNVLYFDAIGYKHSFSTHTLVFKEEKDLESKINTEELKQSLLSNQKDHPVNGLRDVQDLSREYMDPSMSKDKIEEIERKARSLNSSDGDRIHAFFSRLSSKQNSETSSTAIVHDIPSDITSQRYEDKIDDSLPNFYRELRKEIEQDSQFYHRYEIIFLESEEDYSPEYVTFDYDRSADINRIGHDPHSFGMTDEDPAIVHWLDQINAHSKDKLAMRQKRFKRIMRAFSVADYRDNPAYIASSGSCWVWLEENATQDKLLIQLGNHVPPTLWIPLKPKKESLKKLFDEVTAMEAGGAGRIMESTDEMLSKINFNDKDVQTKSKQEDLLKYINNSNPESIDNHFQNTFSMFLGNTNEMRTIEESFMNNPYTFNTPIILGSSNKHSRGKPVVVSKFRTTLTRSVITLVARYDFQLHLASNDDDSTWNVPIFAIIHYPDNMLISKPIPQRINKLFNVHFPDDTPLDVVGALLPYKMRTWQSVREYITGMEQDAVPPQIIAQLGVLGDAAFSEIFDKYAHSTDPVYRLACVIGATHVGMTEEADKLMESESRQEVQDIMRTYVEKAKKNIKESSI